MQRIKKAEEISQDLTQISKEDEYENSYRAETLCYIANDKEATNGIKRKIEEFDRKAWD